MTGQDTSKFPPHPDIHGRHGLFLASVASLSLVFVASHHRDYHSHNSMSVHNSKVLTRHTPCLPEQRVLTFSHGTRVTVKDLFGTMPVRVKHRALQAEKSTFSRDWDRLLLDVVALLIAWPGSVAVSIRDASSRQTLTLKTNSQPNLWVNDSCRLLHQASLSGSPDASDWVIIGASSPTLSVSGYVCRVPVATKRAQFISLGIEPLSNEFRCNVLYEEVNRVFADSSFGTVEDESDSDEIPRKAKPEGFTNKELKVRKGVDRWPMFFLKMSPTSPPTQRPLEVDDILDDRQLNLALVTDLLKAMFYEFLKKNHCRPKKVNLSTKSKLHSQKDTGNGRRFGPNYDLYTAPNKGSSRAAHSLDLTPTDEPVRKAPQLETPDSRLEASFAAWSKIKSGQPLQTFRQSASRRSHTQSASTTPTQRSRNSTPGYNFAESSRPVTQAEPSHPLYDANGKLTRKPFEDMDLSEDLSRSSSHVPERESDDQLIQSSHCPPQEETFQWINPATKMATTVNSRTGFVTAPKPLTLSRRAFEDEARRPSCEPDERNSTTQRATPWIRDLVRKWRNPVFELTETPIPKLPDVSETLGLDPAHDSHHCHRDQTSFNVGNRHETSALTLQGRLSKDTLRKAQLIAQVDRKFIFSKIDFDRMETNTDDAGSALVSSSVLVLIDQHAADERCRVEGLMKEYFKPATDSSGQKIWKAVAEVLPKPVQFELSVKDKDVLSRFQQHLEFWGICYDIQSPASEISRETNQNRMKSQSIKTKVSVRSLPPAIAERCRTEPRLLAELIRKEAWRLNDEDRFLHHPIPRMVSEQDDESGVPVWVSLFHGCPQGIVELINSRSCRSAIMFNDPLTTGQCSALLDRLTQCAFPFQCAHGRPSMVPLVDLGEGLIQLGNMVKSNGRADGGEPFGQAFKKWKETR